MSDPAMDPMHELVEDYALDLLDGEERAAFEARLEVDPTLRRELAATIEALAALAFSTPTTPAPTLKDRVMARIDAAPDKPATVIPFGRPVRPSRASAWLSVALAAALIVVLKLALDLRGARQSTETAQLASAAAIQKLARRDSLVAQLTDPGVELVTMAATGAPKPAIKVYINRTRRSLILSAASLGTPAAGRAYQLWFIVDGKPVPSVTFKPDSSGRAVITDVPMPAGIAAATAITSEPEGGSTTPTMPILFLGKLATE